MTDKTERGIRGYTRREVLGVAAGLGAAAALRGLPTWAAEAPLLTRPIPRTGERLPVVGLGTAIVFDIGENAAQRAERRTVVEAMLGGGGTLIDTAPSYGTAESVVGDLLAQLGARDKVFLATKVRAGSRDAAAAEMQQSLAQLRTQKIDLMQWHNVGTDLAEVAGQVAQLREWKEKGVFRYIGVTHFQERANDRLVEILKREKLDFVQVNYSLAERSVEERVLPVAAETGTAVLCNLPFGRGRLFSAVRGRPVPEWAAEFGATTWGTFYLKYLLAHPAVNCVIPGSDKPEYMVDNLNAGRGRLPDASQRKRMVEFWNSVA